MAQSQWQKWDANSGENLSQKFHTFLVAALKCLCMRTTPFQPKERQKQIPFVVVHGEAGILILIIIIIS